MAGADWLFSRRYNIIAKLPPATSKEQFQLMLQALLAERFHLILHRETRQLQGFELIVAKNGPKLKPSKETPPSDSNPREGPPKTDARGYPEFDGAGLLMMEGVRGKAVLSFVTAKMQPINALADLIGREFQLPILDKTGLSGNFDFQLEFAPQPPGALPAILPAGTLPEPSDDSGPNLVTAVQQQLGLKLNPTKVPVEVLVIDRADQVPTEN